MDTSKWSSARVCHATLYADKGLHCAKWKKKVLPLYAWRTAVVKRAFYDILGEMSSSMTDVDPMQFWCHVAFPVHLCHPKEAMSHASLNSTSLHLHLSLRDYRVFSATHTTCVRQGKHRLRDLALATLAARNPTRNPTSVFLYIFCSSHIVNWNVILCKGHPHVSLSFN